MKNITFTQNHMKKSVKPHFPLGKDATSHVRAFHRSIPGYEKTPLVELAEYAGVTGVGAIFVKDESLRLGLNAFKGLGGTYAMFRMICSQLELDYRSVTLQDLLEEPFRSRIREMTFITTTDGNHGKGVSYAAGLFGCKAHVYLPAGSVEDRAQAIRDAGNAEAVITDMQYDDCVEYTAELAKRNGWLLIQDTSWPGYEEIPFWIVQGYSTMVFEALEQMEKKGYEKPTHVFLQAGVGAMAGGVTGTLHSIYGADCPVICSVEPSEAACIFASVAEGTGQPVPAAGTGITMMAGLNCMVPCTITWPVLRDNISFAFSCGDEIAAEGMRRYANPPGGDKIVISGESGAATLGLLAHLLEDPQFKDIRKRLGLDKNAVILLFNTEGDTDPANYQKIINGE